MKLRAEEISSIIEDQIASFDKKVEAREVGTIISVGDGIARVHGLDNVKAMELVEFPGGVTGIALNLEEDNVGVVLMGDERHLKEGDEVRRTERIAEIPVGTGLLGRVVNPLGQPQDGKGPIAAEDKRRLEVIAPGIIKRQPVSQPPGRQTQDVALGRTPQAQHRAVRVGEIRRELIDFENLAIAVTGGAQAFDPGFGHRRRIAGQGFRVTQRALFLVLERAGFDLARVERGADRRKSRGIAQQSLQALGMMVDAIGATVEQAHPDANRFEKPFRHRVAAVMQHGLVERHVPFHRMRA